MLTVEQIVWTREALERLYDLAFLERHITLPPVAGRYASARAVQHALIEAIQQIKPPTETPLNSMAWRVYNALHERYLSGMTQTEAAAELNVSLRQLRRDQMRGVAAVAALLFEAAGTEPAVTSTASLPDRPHSGLTHIDEALRSAVTTLEPLLSQQTLHVSVHAEAPLPPAIGDRMVIRQLLILSLNWVIQDARCATLEARIEPANTAIWVTLPAPASCGPQSDLDAITHLADRIGAIVQTCHNPPALQITFPASVRRCILMIDDDPDAIELVRRSLETTDEFNLVAVTHPEEALREALEIRPDCILLDVMMPVLDGWELLAQFKSHPQLAGTPIVVSSVLGSETLARALGASDVLPRPYSALSLLQTLRAVTAVRPTTASTPGITAR